MASQMNPGAYAHGTQMPMHRMASGASHIEAEGLKAKVSQLEQLVETHWRLLERLPNVNVVFGELSVRARQMFGNMRLAILVSREPCRPQMKKA